MDADVLAVIRLHLLKHSSTPDVLADSEALVEALIEALVLADLARTC